MLGGRGDDVLKGNAGSDTASSFREREGYVILRDGSDWLVRDRFRAPVLNEGFDLLEGFEFLKFSDMILPLTSPPRPSGVRPGAHSEFLFDSVYYLVSHGGALVDKTAAGALNHWRSTGASEGYSPTSWFDATWYENRWSDLKALQLSDEVLFWHFNLSGVWEGRAPGPKFERFDGARYLAENRDVAAYVDGHIPGRFVRQPQQWCDRALHSVWRGRRAKSIRSNRARDRNGLLRLRKVCTDLLLVDGVMR